MASNVKFDGENLRIDSTPLRGVYKADLHMEYGVAPTMKVEMLAWPLNMELDRADIHIRATVDTLQQACAVLLAEYRNDADFRKAVIDSMTDVTADVGLSERIADRLFDMETEYADSTTGDS